MTLGVKVVITGDVDVVQIELVGRHAQGELTLLRGEVDSKLSLTDHKFIPERREGEISCPGDVLYEETDVEGFPLTTPGL